MPRGATASHKADVSSESNLSQTTAERSDREAQATTPLNVLLELSRLNQGRPQMQTYNIKNTEFTSAAFWDRELIRTEPDVFLKCSEGLRNMWNTSTCLDNEYFRLQKV